MQRYYQLHLILLPFRIAAITLYILMVPLVRPAWCQRQIRILEFNRELRAEAPYDSWNDDYCNNAEGTFT